MSIFLLLLAALLWIGVHIGISGMPQYRARAVQALGGEQRFLLGFTGASVVSLLLLILAYVNADPVVMYQTPDFIRFLAVLLMLPALTLFMASHKNNPTAVGNKGLGQEPHGIQRVTRHPMLWSFALWAGLHLIANGELAAWIFFGAFLVTAAYGMPSIDAKIAARNPDTWPSFAARTSILPFAAIIGGRNRLDLNEIGWVPFAGGFVLWALLIFFHETLFGVPATVPY
jgi:uncharacterized membrane protein